MEWTLAIALAYAVWAGRDIALRHLALIKARAEKELERAQMSQQPPAPAFIAELANEFQDEWAREHMMQRAGELFNELKDWNRVGAQLKQETRTLEQNQR